MKRFIKKYFILTQNIRLREDVSRDNAGFTLIETLVSVVILLLAVVGPMRIASQGAALGIRSRDELGASYLAQDGIEYIRYKIITNMNAGIANPVIGDADLSKCLSSAVPPKCAVDTVTDGVGGTAGKISSCTGGACPNLMWTDTGSVGLSRYGLTAGTSTDFVREVTITPYTGGAIYNTAGVAQQIPSEWYIESTVSWGKPGETGKTLTVGENLVDWRIVYR